MKIKNKIIYKKPCIKERFIKINFFLSRRGRFNPDESLLLASVISAE